MIYVTLFFEFFKIGIFSIGGGLATLPFLQELVDKYGWITSQELIDMIAISESTPGPIGVNAATYMGYKTAGVLGGVVATLGIVVPAVIIISIVAHYFMKFNEQAIVKSAFYGLRPAVTGMIAAACYQITIVSLFNTNISVQFNNLFKLISDFINIKEIILFIAVLYLLEKYKKHPVLYLAGAAVVGIILKL
jgi:chromate transporter